MAEPQRISSPPVRPRPTPRLKPPHPSRVAAPPRRPLDETQDLSPPAPGAEPAARRQIQAVETGDQDCPGPAQRRRAERGRRPHGIRLPARTPAEWALLTVLLVGLGLNAAVLLLNPALTPADVLLGATVLLAGAVLLALMEICRRGGPVSR